MHNFQQRASIRLDCVENEEDAPTRVAKQGKVQSIDRAVAILQVFSRARPIAGISEIARLTGLTRGTTHRLVTSLTTHGLLTQVPGSSTYSLGPLLLSLATMAEDQLSLETQARPVMTWLRDQTNETVGLHVLDAEPSRRTIAQVESLQPLRRTYTDLGSPRPPHQGAPGMALLAFTDAKGLNAARDQLSEHPDILAQLDQRLIHVRESGYAISLEERVPGVVAIAMPVFDHTGLAAALSVSIPTVRAGRDELVQLVPLLSEAVDRLSTSLGRSAKNGEQA